MLLPISSHYRAPVLSVASPGNFCARSNTSLPNAHVGIVVVISCTSRYLISSNIRLVVIVYRSRSVQRCYARPDENDGRRRVCDSVLFLKIHFFFLLSCVNIDKLFLLFWFRPRFHLLRFVSCIILPARLHCISVIFRTAPRARVCFIPTDVTNSHPFWFSTMFSFFFPPR